MKNVPSTLLSSFHKRIIKHMVEELKDRDDYQTRISEVVCSDCEGKAETLEFRIYGEKDWMSAYKGLIMRCKACSEKTELSKAFQSTNLINRKQLKVRFEYDYWHVPNDLVEAGFKNFKVNNDSVLYAKKTLLDYVRKFAETDPNKRHNILIMGNPGTGKTHLVTALARTVRQKGYLVGLLTTGTLLSMIKTTYQKGACKTEHGILNDLKKMDLLILDDLGSEARSKDEFDWSKNKLFEIVNKRIGKPTIYTSNLNEQHLPTAIGERVTSRLYYNTKIMQIVTEDYRKKYQII